MQLNQRLETILILEKNEAKHPWKGQLKETSASAFLLLLIAADCMFIFYTFCA